MSTEDAQQFQERIQRIEMLVERIEQSASPAVCAAARDMVRILLDLHGAGLSKLLAHLAESGEPGQRILEACVRDDLLASLLKLHELHPHSLEARVNQALERARPYLQSHGGDVEIAEIAGNTVRLRMQGSCNGCPSSSATLKQTIEQAIHEDAPEITTIETEDEDDDPAAASGLVQLGLPKDRERHDPSPASEADRESSNTAKANDVGNAGS